MIGLQTFSFGSLLINISHIAMLLALLVFACYFIYTRFLKPLYIIWFYSKQGIPLIKYHIPILGHAMRVAKAFLKDPTKVNSIISGRMDYPDNPPPICMVCLGNDIKLTISEPKIIKEILTQHST